MLKEYYYNREKILNIVLSYNIHSFRNVRGFPTVLRYVYMATQGIYSIISFLFVIDICGKRIMAANWQQVLALDAKYNAYRAPNNPQFSKLTGSAIYIFSDVY